jgi:hypothetical protein
MSDAAEESLAELVEELTRRLEAGEAIDIERVRREHPELAGELEALVPALAAVEGFGRGVESGDAGRALGGSGVLGPIDVDDPAAGGSDRRRTLGDYRILREVGRGGMAEPRPRRERRRGRRRPAPPKVVGAEARARRLARSADRRVVYEAEQLSLGRRVALKALPFAAVLDPRQIQRFRNEAHAAAQLHHGNIVPVYSVGCVLGDEPPGCEDACDSNDDRVADISDAISTLGVLFLGQGEIPLPGPNDCGPDPTEDELGCGTWPESCE